MADRTVDRRKHIVLVDTARAEAFTSPSARGKDFERPKLDREGHGRALRKQMERIQEELEKRRHQLASSGLEIPSGATLEFESSPGFLLKLESMEFKPKGIVLCASYQRDGRHFAIVFVPEGELSFFIERVEDYLTKTSDKGNPRHRDLVESIAQVRLTVAESFWTDSLTLLPSRQSVVWWEAWLRGDGPDVGERFRKAAGDAQIFVAHEQQSFPDRTVVLIRGSLEQLSASLTLLDMLAELRRVKQLGGFFMRLPHRERGEWLQDLMERIHQPSGLAVAVTVLDSGVYRAHPLLASVLAEEDCHVWNPLWPKDDARGHGTKMAGIAMYGDLSHALSSSEPVLLSHRLESVKIVPPVDSNPEHLYGHITSDAVSLVEIRAPLRQRVFSLALTADASDQGQPSAWSAEIDKLSAGTEDDERRLFFVSAGNIQAEPGKDYPHRNALESVQDPGQSWNAVTVGAYTAMTELNEVELEGWTCLAPPGGLGPASTTSITWEPTWALKPDIVMEGGNMALSPNGAERDTPDSLSLLTTYHLTDRPFTSTGDTSAATANAARVAALLRAQYPQLWPETIRSLLVDSAEWSPHMKRELSGAGPKRSVEVSLRHFGFGTPNLERALWSAGSSLTLIAQDELQPFEKDRSKEMNLHKLPWPRAALEALGSVEVELRITLSYFIEPNPARRGWRKRHRYASHGLRFAVQKPMEDVNGLRKRVNAEARDEEEEVTNTGDAEGWLLGSNLRGKGSLHHDRWTGTAAELARREHIAVYPVIGWWRERRALGRSESKARYALVVTIRTPATGIDIYQPVAVQVGVAVSTDV